MISFIMPIYNTDIYDLKKTIDSVYRKNLEQFEIILVNDGSTDKQIDVYCKEVKCKDEEHIVYIYQKNQGAAVARNRGLESATGDYICFIDADDELLDDFPDDTSLSKFNFDILVFDYYSYDGKDQLFHLGEERELNNEKDDIYSNILLAPGTYNGFMFGAIWAKLFNRSFLQEKNIRFSDRLRKAQDRRFMLEAVNKAENIFYLPYISYRYYSHMNSITHKRNLNMVKYYGYLYEDIKKYIEMNNIDIGHFKYFSYSIVNEALLLTIYHRENDLNFHMRYKIYRELAKRCELKKYLRHIKISQMPTRKGKLRMILFKLDFFVMIDRAYRYLYKA